MIPQLSKYTLEFPNPLEVTQSDIVAWGGDLSPSRLIKAYQEGIFPWYSKDDPILWWSPDPRFIMELDDFKLSKSLKKSLKKFTYKIDKNFAEVIKECAKIPRKNQNGTWILDEVIEAYATLHAMGYAHSFESYFEGELVGGLYGISIGKVFCGESMFSKKSDASKAAFYTMVKHLKKWGYDFIDAQVYTDHLASLGAKEVSKKEFLERLYKSRYEILSHNWEIQKEIL